MPGRRWIRWLRWGLSLCAALPGAASAATLDWSGTLSVELGTNPPILETGTGVATLTSTASGALTSIALAGGITGSQTIPLTDPNNSELVTLIATAALGTATIGGPTPTASPIYLGGPLVPGALPIPGAAKLCVILQGCGGGLDIPLTQNGTRGIGIGGLVTISGYGPGTRISIQGGPWTVSTARVVSAFTTNAMVPGESRMATLNYTLDGFAHGPSSGASTANIGGALQLVNAQFVATNLNSPSNLISLRITTTLDFVPEPGLVLMLGAGVAALVLIGRDRLRP